MRDEETLDPEHFFQGARELGDHYALEVDCMEVLEAVESRRSIRKFTGEPVREEDLATMLRAATLAPNAGNKQRWRFIVIRNRDILRRMREAVEAEMRALVSFGQKTGMLREGREVRSRLPANIFFDTAPMTIAACERIDPPDSRERLWRAKGLNDAEIERMRPSRGVQSIAAGIENLMLAAWSLGYGTCWMTGPLIAVQHVEEILGIEPPFRLVSLVPIGRAAESPRARPRKRLEETISVIV